MDENGDLFGDYLIKHDEECIQLIHCVIYNSQSKRHLLQASRRLRGQDCRHVRAAIVPPQEACQVVREKAKGKGVRVMIVVLRIIIYQLTDKVFDEFKMDGHSPSSPKKESFPSFVLDRKKLKSILCGWEKIILIK